MRKFDPETLLEFHELDELRRMAGDLGLCHTDEELFYASFVAAALNEVQEQGVSTEEYLDILHTGEVARFVAWRRLKRMIEMLTITEVKEVG